MTSNKYPNWKIEKDGNGYLMTRPDWEAQGTYYAVIVSEMGNEWVAELLTRQTVFGVRCWEAAYNQVNGTAAKVTAEAERRATYWLNKRAA